jgi:uncharacterized protein (UPF0264 family)
MRLLVSVATEADAAAALAGGADVIDAKDPLAGALGAVSSATFRAIHACVGGVRPVSAALGDAVDEDAIEALARAFAAAGAAFVKVGFAGISDASRVTALTTAAVQGAREGNGAVVAVAYADDGAAVGITPSAIIAAAARGRAAGVLVDTADKLGPGLTALVAPDVLGEWAAQAHRGGLFLALAGKLTIDDLPVVRDAGADVAGVRGAACDGGRAGRIASSRVRALADSVRRDRHGALAAPPDR